MGVKVHCMGVGSPKGSIIRNPETNQEIVSKLDEASLQEIAKITGGDYYRVTPGGDEILLILKQIYDSSSSNTTHKNLSAMKEQYYLFGLLALFLLVAESLIDPRRRRGFSK